jgi:hypothetical protein
MNGYEKLLVFAQIVGIVGIWLRFENRLSRLEGRFDMFFSFVSKTLGTVEKRH